MHGRQLHTFDHDTGNDSDCSSRDELATLGTFRTIRPRVTKCTAEASVSVTLFNFIAPVHVGKANISLELHLNMFYIPWHANLQCVYVDL